MFEETTKVLNTVRYMTPRQWRYRLYYMIRNKIQKRKPKALEREIEPFLLSASFETDFYDRDAVVIADGICNGNIPTISGIVKRFTGDWNLGDEEYRLVCFKLNSFYWLSCLSDAYKATGDKKYIDIGFGFIRDWNESNGFTVSGDKWNAYVIAERITNWIGFCSKYAKDDIKQYIPWIYAQVQELKVSIEYQLGANHLLSEAKALLLAGVFLRDDGLCKRGKRLLIDEAREQFLPDGGHYERSVSYHVEALQQYFESYAVLKAVGDSDARMFAELMKEPYKFLDGMIGVNGKIPLFNDAAYDYPFFDAADFLSTADLIYSDSPPKGRRGSYYNRWSWVKNESYEIDWDRKVRYENTGFIHYQFDFGGRKYSLFIDCGDSGPDYNLGHTHADALSVLLYSDNKEILTDSGVFTYRLGEARNACRSTRAHNTVEVDGENSAEVWSAFRVAKRGHTKVTECVWENGLKVKASHDGYTKCLGERADHNREVVVDSKAGVIAIADRLDTDRPHKAVSRYHIGRECSIEQIDGHTCRIDKYIQIKSDASIRIVECMIADMFGIPEKSKCIEIEFKERNKTIIEIGETNLW